MLPEKFSLKDLISRKAKDYYEYSRNSHGIPTKTLEQCRREALEDYSSIDLDAYNTWWKSHWNRLMDTPQQIVWSDGTYDDKRECDTCSTSCSAPVHQDAYKEIGKEDTPDTDIEDYTSWNDTGYEDVRKEDLK